MKYGKFWARRPAIGIHVSPIDWWKHLGNCVIDECRSKYPIRKISDILLLRRSYISTYYEIKRRSKNLVMRSDRQVKPRSKRWQRKESDAELASLLTKLEGKLTLAQVFTFRTFVALLYSVHLNRHPDQRNDCVSLMDAMNIFMDAPAARSGHEGRDQSKSGEHGESILPLKRQS